MGICGSIERGNNASLSPWEGDPRIFIQKMKLLQQEISAILKQREEESEVYERELMMFGFKEAEWKREKKKLKEEVKRLRKSLEEREERIRLMEMEFNNNSNNNGGFLRGKSEKLERETIGDDGGSIIGPTTTTTTNSSMTLVEKMREERARRDETVEKWKMLYLAIKHELDDLIKRTHEGTLYWRAEGEDFIEQLQMEVKAKDETIEALKAQIASMEDDDYKRKREIDILRQSLRIMSSNINNNKGPTCERNIKNMSKTSNKFSKNLSKLTLVS